MTGEVNSVIFTIFFTLNEAWTDELQALEDALIIKYYI